MNAPPEYVFFTDRDLGKQFPEALRQAAIRVERHGDHFADDAKDEDWLREVGQRNWYVLTHDKRMRYRPNEIAAIERFKVGVFLIVGKAPFPELAQNFVLTFPHIVKFIQENPRPFIAKVFRPDESKKKMKTHPAGTVKAWVSF